MEGSSRHPQQCWSVGPAPEATQGYKLQLRIGGTEASRQGSPRVCCPHQSGTGQGWDIPVSCSQATVSLSSLPPFPCLPCLASLPVALSVLPFPRVCTRNLRVSGMVSCGAQAEIAAFLACPVAQHPNSASHSSAQLLPRAGTHSCLLCSFP